MELRQQEGHARDVHGAHEEHEWLEPWPPWIPLSRLECWWSRSRGGLQKREPQHLPRHGTITCQYNYIARMLENLHQWLHGHLEHHVHVLGHVHGQMVYDGHLRLRNQLLLH